jgi:4-amino-4-deoxy-L-arabinose transferase-like glycosyltransferase
MSLLVLSIPNLPFLAKYNLSLIEKISPILILISVFSGFIVFYTNKDKVKKEIDQEQINESSAEQKRFEEFPEKFPVINKIPIFKNIIRYVHKEGWWRIIALLTIFIAFTAVKAPYFGVSFTGEHTMKYNAYVEPAKYMLEKNNPFWNQQKYQANPVNNPEGIFKIFGNPPLIEWGLVTTYYLFPYNSAEFNTRLFTHFLGILILFLSYLFFSKWLSKENSLIITFLISINPIISFISFVTTEDSLLLIFTFLSLIYLLKYFKNNNFFDLFLCGFLFGIGNTAKYSLFLWLAPIIFILLAFSGKKPSTFLKNFSIIIVLSLLPIIGFKTSLLYLPTNATLSLLGFFIWWVVFVRLYFFVKKNEATYENLIERAFKHKILCLMFLFIMIAFGFLFLYSTKLYKFSNEFLTDSTLIFNLDMYKFMLKEQFKPYMTQNVYYLGLIGLVFSLLIGLKKQRLILLSFFIGAFVYWISASKVIFFHNYYTAIIMIVFCLSVGIMVYLLGKAIGNKFLFFFLLLLVGILLFPASYDANTKRMSKEVDQSVFVEACKYLIKQTSPSEKYIDGNYVLSLTICSERGAITRDHLDSQTLRNSVIKKGFTETMREYKIKYLITTGEGIDFRWFANLYSADLSSVGRRRSDNILSQMGEKKFFEDADEREKIITENNVATKIKLEKEIGSYKFYSFY